MVQRFISKVLKLKINYKLIDKYKRVQFGLFFLLKKIAQLNFISTFVEQNMYL